MAHQVGLEPTTLPLTAGCSSFVTDDGDPVCTRCAPKYREFLPPASSLQDGGISWHPEEFRESLPPALATSDGFKPRTPLEPFAGRVRRDHVSPLGGGGPEEFKALQSGRLDDLLRERSPLRRCGSGDGCGHRMRFGKRQGFHRGDAICRSKPEVVCVIGSRLL